MVEGSNLMETWPGRALGVAACVWGAGMASFGAAVGIHLFDGAASVLVSGWFALSVPVAFLAGVHLSEMGPPVVEGNGSSGGELSGQEDWGMRSDRFPVYTSQSPEAGSTSRMRSSERPER